MLFRSRLTQNLGQQVIVENRAGAGGNIGTVAAAKAKADGYTLMLTTNSVQVINPWLYKNTGFDPIKDFEPVTTVCSTAFTLAMGPMVPAGVKTVKDFIAWARAIPQLALSEFIPFVLNS